MKGKIYTLTLALILLGAISVAQAQEEIKKKEKIRVKILEEVDGEEKLIEKTYSTREEMMNDPELKEHNFEFLESEGGIKFKNGDGKRVIIKSFHDSDGMDDLEWVDQKDGHVSVFVQSSDGEGEPKVRVLGGDGDFKIHRLKEGEDSRVEVGEDVFEFEKGDDGKMEILKNGKPIDSEFIFDSEEINKLDGEGHVFIMRSGDGEKSIVREFKVRKIHVEDIKSKDPELEGLELDQKKLKLDELNYYPNPSDGELNLAFKADPKATEVRLTDLNGKIVHLEVMPNFEGTYDKTIDLSNQPAGIYLLQVVQGDRAMNKKLIIE